MEVNGRLDDYREKWMNHLKRMGNDRLPNTPHFSIEITFRR